MALATRQYGKGVKLALLCAVLMLLVGCTAASKQKSHQELFLLCVDRFNAAVRWEDYRQAVQWLAPPLQKPFWDLTDRLHGHVRVMDYEIRHHSVTLESPHVDVTLTYRFYYTRDPRLQTKTLHQRWIFLEKEETWQLVRHDFDLLLPDWL